MCRNGHNDSVGGTLEELEEDEERFEGLEENAMF
jgi:hypothetical protein